MPESLWAMDVTAWKKRPSGEGVNLRELVGRE